MTNINATNLRKKLYELLKQTIKYNEPINVSTKDGNVIIISEEDYNGLIETLYLTSSSKMKEKLINGKNVPKEDCIPAKEVKW